MKFKKLEYQHKDMPLLKKDTIFRLVFMSLFLIIFVWQLISMFFNYFQNSLSMTMMIVSVIVLLVSLILTLTALIYAFRDINIINQIRHQGKAVRTISVISNNKKGSFLKMYNYLSKFIAFVMFLVLVCGVTYSVLELVYYSSITFYMPILILFAISGFNSVYHIKMEMKTIDDVQEYNALY